MILHIQEIGNIEMEDYTSSTFILDNGAFLIRDGGVVVFGTLNREDVVSISLMLLQSFLLH